MDAAPDLLTDAFLDVGVDFKFNVFFCGVFVFAVVVVFLIFAGDCFVFLAIYCFVYFLTDGFLVLALPELFFDELLLPAGEAAFFTVLAITQILSLYQLFD